MNEFIIFAICGLLVIVVSLISIWANDEVSEQITADNWPWMFPM